MSGPVSSSGNTCFWCKKQLPTLKGLSSHLSQAKLCRKAQKQYDATHITGQHTSTRSPDTTPSVLGNLETDTEGQQPTDNDIEMADHLNFHSNNTPSHVQYHPELPIPEGSAGDAPMPLNPTSSKTNHYWVKPLDNESKPKVLGHTRTRWEQMRSNEDPANPFAPWNSKEEYELVEWLATSGLSQAAIDRFLNLNWVSYLTDVLMSMV